MSTFEKTKQDILASPTKTDIMPNDLKNFLKRYGFELKRVKGDHFIYKYPAKRKSFILSIPMAKPVKPTYIDQVRKIILEIEEDDEL